MAPGESGIPVLDQHQSVLGLSAVQRLYATVDGQSHCRSAMPLFGVRGRQGKGDEDWTQEGVEMVAASATEF